MTKFSKTCIFCGSRRVTREHIFADWMRELFPRSGTFFHKLGTLKESALQPGTPDLKEHRRPGHGGSRKVRAVCGSCNSGWLSRLESKIKPLLIAMAQGEQIVITPEGQKLLATWAAKTAMTADRIRVRDDCISFSERSYLKANLEPPINWLVWIGSYNGLHRSELGVSQTRGKVQATPTRAPHVKQYYVQSTTFGIGRSLFLVISTDSEQLSEKFNKRRRSGMFQIWPATISRTLLWPNIRTLGDHEATAIANVVRNSGVLNHAIDPLADWILGFEGFVNTRN